MAENLGRSPRTINGSQCLRQIVPIRWQQRITNSVADIQSLEDRIARAASQFGLKINIKKTEYFTGQCNT